MSEEELEILEKSRDPLVKKFVSHYKDAFYDNRIKKLHIAQLEVADLLIEDMGKLKGLKNEPAQIDSEEEEYCQKPNEGVSMNLFGNKVIFAHAMEMFKNMGVILASIKAGEVASEIIHQVEEVKTKKRTRMPAGVPTE